MILEELIDEKKRQKELMSVNTRVRTSENVLIHKSNENVVKINSKLAKGSQQSGEHLFRINDCLSVRTASFVVL